MSNNIETTPDIQFLNLNVEPPEEIARLYLKNGKIYFEGDADEGARGFFQEILKPMVDEYIANELRRLRCLEK